MSDLAPSSATEVAQFLATLSRRLYELTNEINAADRIAVRARENYIRTYAVAYLKSDGTGPVREQTAKLETSRERLAAEEAEADVRDKRRQIDSVRVRIDVGRSYGAAVRAESELFKSPFGGGA